MGKLIWSHRAQGLVGNVFEIKVYESLVPIKLPADVLKCPFGYGCQKGKPRVEYSRYKTKICNSDQFYEHRYIKNLLYLLVIPVLVGCARYSEYYAYSVCCAQITHIVPYTLDRQS